MPNYLRQFLVNETLSHPSFGNCEPHRVAFGGISRWRIPGQVIAFVLAAGLCMGGKAANAQTPGSANQEYYELRLYHFPSAETQHRFEAFLRDALIPALNRAGVSPVGAFTVENKPEEHSLYLLLPFHSIRDFVSLDGRLAADTVYLTAGAAVLALPATDPPYTRIDSSLLAAFEGMPHLQIPSQTAAKQGRAFELRNYESASEKAGKKKIEMFNQGEIDVFRRAGFQPVFYGETIIGANRPSLTYMVTYPEGANRGGLWGKFGADPAGKKLFATPGYSDKEIVSKINHVFLVPLDCSQI